MDEKVLLRHIRQGDRAAMKQLYDNHIGYLKAVCSRYIPDNDDVNDILQDSFVKIFGSTDKFEYRREGSLRAWMTRIVVNESLKRLRQKKKWSELISTEPPPDVIDEDGTDVPLFADIPPDKIMEMIRSLPDGYRTILNLYVFEDKSHREIAEMLGIRESSSASQLHRAKVMLVKMAEKYKSSME